MLIPNLHIWLLAGGSGERLWPLSNKNHPKQLLKLNGKTLLEHSLERVLPLVDQNNIAVITTEKYAAPILDKVGTAVGALCVEPAGKNTAPAIYLAAATLQQLASGAGSRTFYSPDPVIFIMPTDHYVAKPDLFREFVQRTVAVAQENDSIVLLGIEPTWPATGYGYIEYHNSQVELSARPRWTKVALSTIRTQRPLGPQGLHSGTPRVEDLILKDIAPHRVIRFHEKPQQEVAQNYLVSGNFLWNSGMLCARLSVLIQAFEQSAPDIVSAIQGYLQGTGSYQHSPSISMDYAILEKSKNLLVLPAGFPWCDVGTVETFLELQEPQATKNLIEVDSKNNLVSGEGSLIALVGIEDVCVVQKDGMLLIAKKGHTEKVRAVVDTLKRKETMSNNTSFGPAKVDTSLPGHGKRAFVTGVTGQDGTYLSELLLEKGYEVHGLIRYATAAIPGRIEQLKANSNRFFLHYGDLNDGSSLQRIIDQVKPHEVYNLAAQSHVHVSFQMPECTANTDALGTLRILEAIRASGLAGTTRFYQASSSELFGKVREIPQTENTPFYPRSPYAVAKLYAYWITVNYRESYNMFACNGILFNHESPYRGELFVTRKITRAAARIKVGLQDVLHLGNLDAERDWGYAKDYVEAMWLMLQQEKPQDYVIASGEKHTVREFVELTFKELGTTIVWTGKGLDEKGVDAATGKPLVVIDPKFVRPAEVDLLLGNPAKAHKELGWKPKCSFANLVSLMVANDYGLACKEKENLAQPVFKNQAQKQEGHQCLNN